MLSKWRLLNGLMCTAGQVIPRKRQMYRLLLIAPKPQARSIKQVCWHCLNPLPPATLACPNCKALQEPYFLNCFELLKVPATFNLSQQDLRANFHLLQTQYHPDKQLLKDKTQLDISHRVSTRLNRAYKVLSDPYTRAVYLLYLKGDKDIRRDVDEEFAQSMMRLISNDMDQAYGVQRLAKSIETKMNQLTDQLGEDFRREDFEGAKMTLAKMRIVVALGSKMRELINKYPQ